MCHLEMRTCQRNLTNSTKRLNSVGKILNFIKAGGLCTRQFKELGKDVNSTHEMLSFHTAVRWLSKGNVLIILSFIHLFYLYIYPPDSQESDRDANM